MRVVEPLANLTFAFHHAIHLLNRHFCVPDVSEDLLAVFNQDFPRVRTTRRPIRINKWQPSSVSSCLMCWLTVDWERNISLPVGKTACFRGILKDSQLVQIHRLPLFRRFRRGPARFSIHRNYRCFLSEE